MEDPRIISALFIFLKMAYYNVLINNMSDKQFHIHTHKAVSLRIDCFFLTKISDWSNEIVSVGAVQ